jgi:reactive chlorine resistance protein C
VNMQAQATRGRPKLVRAQRLQSVGEAVLRGSLVFLLVFFGALKWTAAEAQGIAPFITNSPLLAWIGRTLGQQGASEVIGAIELTVALFIALRRWSPALALVGGALGMAMFLTTLSFLVTTPNLGDGAAFLLKDLALLGTATWITGEAWVAVDAQRGLFL